jgi:16S rRNA (guanine966-N2)-methyltransferase
MSLRIYGNRQLKTLPGELTRPTLAKVREALFNIWQGAIEDCRWLDLCAGSGAMGAEALCRGAGVAVAIEQSAEACQVVRQNWQQVARPEQRWQVIQGDVVKRLATLQGQQFDRIYFDPPYAGGLYEPVLAAIVKYNLLAPDGEMAVEHSPNGWVVEPIGLTICREKRYGSSALTFYQT